MLVNEHTKRERESPPTKVLCRNEFVCVLPPKTIECRRGDHKIYWLAVRTSSIPLFECNQEELLTVSRTQAAKKEVGEKKSLARAHTHCKFYSLFSEFIYKNHYIYILSADFNLASMHNKKLRSIFSSGNKWLFKKRIFRRK